MDVASQLLLQVEEFTALTRQFFLDDGKNWIIVPE
jgi:hypothetical protein